jgi:hypothetical protein
MPVYYPYEHQLIVPSEAIEVHGFDTVLFVFVAT